jgi:hypothetical protein
VGVWEHDFYSSFLIKTAIEIEYLYSVLNCMLLFCDRMLVYEYVDNGNLEQWLHGDVGPVSPLTWDIRMKIILGTAKGYLTSQYHTFNILLLL